VPNPSLPQIAIPARIRSALASLGQRHPSFCGIALVVVGSAFFASMHAAVRFVSKDLHPFEIAFFRNLFGLLVFLPILMRSGLMLLHTQRIGAHVARGFINASSMLAWFTALSLIPLADATSLALTGPLFVTLGAMLFLGETVRARRWIALLVGVAGTVVIIRPGFVDVSIGSLLVLYTAIAVSGSKLIAKSLSRTDSTSTIVAYLTLIMMPITFVAALFFWRWPSPVELAWLVVIGVTGSIGHLCLVKAYFFADVSAVEPITFTRLIWAALIGYLAFAEVPHMWVWIGGGMIVGATSYIAHRVSVLRRERGTDADKKRAGP
jgi:drug/metabolite transporter (DMT)-like permease